MMTPEDFKESPTREVKNARGSGWAIALPVPGPLSWRLRDAWEVFRGRAEAVCEITADQLEQRSLREAAVVDFRPLGAQLGGADEG